MVLNQHEASRKSSSPSTFLSLPFEVRETIYCHLFSSTTRTYRLTLTNGIETDQNALAILQTCRQVYNESHELYHSRSAVRMIGCAPSICSGLRPAILNRLTTLEITAGREDVGEVYEQLFVETPVFHALKMLRIINAIGLLWRPRHRVEAGADGLAEYFTEDPLWWSEDLCDAKRISSLRPEVEIEARILIRHGFGRVREYASAICRRRHGCLECPTQDLRC
jgi:hypothetical protein